MEMSSVALEDISTIDSDAIDDNTIGSDTIDSERISNQSQALYLSLPLNTKLQSIRLLDLFAAEDPQDKQLRGQLRVVNFTHNPTFTALSYVWGTFNDNSPYIICGSYKIRITYNCWSALWHLRNHFAPAQIPIWVDAICINQERDDEKENQIPLMHQIYSRARPVYVWFGDGDADSDMAIDYLEKAGLQQLVHHSNKEQNRSVPASRTSRREAAWRSILKAAWFIFKQGFSSTWWINYRGQLLLPHIPQDMS
jgi:Heterokaryon incompatibility protein (HET)